MPRLHCTEPLSSGLELALPPGPARHVQVLRLQPGDALTLFDGRGGEYAAVVQHMGRSEVRVAVGAHHAIECEAQPAVHLAVGMPANERMDWLVEKATELGAASIQPLLTERTVLRLAGERAQKKQAHWQAIAVAACEQCGRNRVPEVLPLLGFHEYQAPGGPVKLLLSAQGRSIRELQVRGEAVVATDPGGVVRLVNPAAEALAETRRRKITCILLDVRLPDAVSVHIERHRRRDHLGQRGEDPVPPVVHRGGGHRRAQSVEGAHPELEAAPHVDVVVVPVVVAGVGL